MTNDLMKLVHTYRVTSGLAEEIFRIVKPALRMFVFNAIRPPGN